MAGIDDAGLELKRFEIISDELNQLAINSISSDINITGDSIFTPIRNVINREISDLWELGQEVSAQYTINGGELSNLDNLLLLNGILREEGQTDTEFYSKRESMLSADNCVTPNSLQTALLALDGVTYADVIENKTGAEVDGIPAYQFETIVYGGSQLSTAQTIWDWGPVYSIFRNSPYRNLRL